MKQTVYVDVLVSVNIIVDYFLLYAAAVICGRKTERVRLMLASLAGGAGSLMLLLPSLPYALTLLSGLVLSAIMTLVAFGKSRAAVFVRTLLVLYALSAAYCGAMLLLWCLTPVRNLSVNNGVVYINMNPAAIIIAALVFYAVMSLASGRIRADGLRRTVCTVTVRDNGRTAEFEGLVDTGNVLTEPFSGLPVIVAGEESIRGVMPRGMSGFLRGECDAETARRIRAVPYSSAGGSGTLAAFLPENVTIEISGRKIKNVRAYVAALPNESEFCGKALINPDAVDI